MAKYLSQEWLDEARQLSAGQPDRPGATARVQWVVKGAPGGDVKYSWVLADGHLLESHLGTIDDPDFTLTLAYDDAKAVHQGELDLNVAFMQGRMKADGNMGKVMALLPITKSAAYAALQQELRDHTEF
ncbi:MAG: SCP2 sterol-binding domain-containing protein [Acidimicrobiia bacterium]